MDLNGWKPRYITFDCYGTLTAWQMNQDVRPLLEGVLEGPDVDAFLKDFSAYRADEVVGPYKPYQQVLRDSWQRTCNRWRIQYKAADAAAIVDAVASWGPCQDVPQALRVLADSYPLVIFSNAADAMLEGNVALLGADFHRVYTAEQARAYKPRFAAFEYMLDQLGCERDEILHVSSHAWYDLLPCKQLGIDRLVYLRRFEESITPTFDYAETSELSGVAKLLGLDDS